MNFKKNVILKVFSSLIFLFALDFLPIVKAESADSVANNKMESTLSDHRTFYVSSSRELGLRGEDARQDDEIILQNDICIDNKICFNSSIILDLNGHTITVETGNVALIIGKKEFVRSEPYKVVHPGYYTYEEKVKYVEHPDKITNDAYGNVIKVRVSPTREVTQIPVWHPETTETRYKEIYRFNDGLDVLIKNGEIKRMSGRDGTDGIEDSWHGYNGENGETPSAPIQIVSGMLRLSNVVVKGGNGGNGGNGGYQSLVHLPFGGGDAGCGGNGGNAGRAVYLLRKECRVRKCEKSLLISGKPGNGGNSGKPNPNYWVYSGFKGHGGSQGRNTTPIITSGV